MKVTEFKDEELVHAIKYILPKQAEIMIKINIDAAVVNKIT